jgi:hypothetical protein
LKCLDGEIPEEAPTITDASKLSHIERVSLVSLNAPKL